MRKAFTLIEMLVVIAIIAILAGLLMPALARARQEARKAHCMNNEKQVGLCMAMYRNDHRNRLPAVWFSDTPQGQRGYDSSLSIAALWPDYTDQAELFRCMMTDHDITVTWRSSDDSYDINLDGDTDTKEYRFETEVSETNDPDYLFDASVPLNAKSGRAVYADGPDLAYLRAQFIAGGGGGLFPADDYANHIYGANVLCVDSHVAFWVMDDDGVLQNPDLEDQVGSLSVQTKQDSDIYADDNWNGGTNWQDDNLVDCNLGNFIRHPTAKDDDWYSDPGTSSTAYGLSTSSPADCDWDTLDY